MRLRYLQSALDCALEDKVSEKDERNKLRRPCKGCPYGRKTDPGYVRERGENVRRFIGQAVMPFLLPCHTFADREGWPSSASRPQCVGAAMFREAIGAAGMMPDELTRAKSDSSEVFETIEEYLAYHDGCTVEEARRKLATPGDTVIDHARNEIDRCQRSGRRVKL
jgi:hypothetical protein